MCSSLGEMRYMLVAWAWCTQTIVSREMVSRFFPATVIYHVFIGMMPTEVRYDCLGTKATMVALIALLYVHSGRFGVCVLGGIRVAEPLAALLPRPLALPEHALPFSYL